MYRKNTIKLEKVDYLQLSAKARENYNFHQMAAILSNYGYHCLWLNDDWNGADCIAVHIDGISDIKIQLKGNISFDKKYCGKNLYIAFFEDKELYVYPHDALLAQVEYLISDKKWMEQGTYFQTKISKRFQEIIKPYNIPKTV